MKARKVSDLLKPKPDLDIMSELLETEPEHIQVMLSIYNKWNPIFKGEINKPELSSIGDKIRAFKRDLEIEQDKIKDTGYRNEGSTGFRGLLRLIGWWESHRYSTEMLEEMIDQWMKTVEVSLKHFKKMAKREYHPIKEAVGDIFKPKSEEEILFGLNQLKPEEQIRKYVDKLSDKQIIERLPSNFKKFAKFLEKFNIEFTIKPYVNHRNRFYACDFEIDTPKLKVSMGWQENPPYNIISHTITPFKEPLNYLCQVPNVDELIKCMSKLISKNESIGDILKPKSEEEIEKQMRKLSGDELWDLWKDTGQKEYLKRALTKKLRFPISGDDITEAIQEFPDAAETLFPLITKHFPYTLEKQGQKYILYAEWWDQFTDLFQEGREMSEESITKILSGDSWDLFERYGSEDMNLSDEIYAIQKMEKDKGVAYFKSLTDELKAMLLRDFDWLDYDNTMEIKNLKNLTDIAKFLVKYQDERDLEEYVHAFEKALNETKGVADESVAFKELTEVLEREAGFKFDKKYYSEKDQCYKIPLSKESIIRIFKMVNIEDEKIKYSPPYYGYNGNIYDHPDVFNDSLSNSIAEIDEG